MARSPRATGGKLTCDLFSPGMTSIFAFVDIEGSIGPNPLPRSISSFVWHMLGFLDAKVCATLKHA